MPSTSSLPGQGHTAGCLACPFTCSPEAENGINWGCLPSIGEARFIAKTTGASWGCHEAEHICAGFVADCAETGFDYRNAPVLSYTIWANEGLEAALAAISRAEGRP